MWENCRDCTSFSSCLGEVAVEVVVEEVVENQTAGVVEKEAATAGVIGEEIVEQAMDTKNDPEPKQSELQEAVDKATRVIEKGLNETVVEERCSSEHLGARRSCNCSSRGWSSQRY
jgi:hypothetical protein